jgi:hypothetical protein
MRGAVAETSGLVQSARKLTRHLQELRPIIYWGDFLSAHLIGCAAFYFVAARVLPWPLRSLAFAVCVLLWYRSITFIHGLAQFRPGQMRLFVQIWNLLAGIPFLCPSLLYSAPLHHHSNMQYGTREDGEYTPWGVALPGNILAFPVSSAGAPVLALLRFGFPAPATWMVTALHLWVYQRASALVVHGSHRRSFPGAQDLRNWRIQETAEFLWISLVTGSAISGRLAWRWPLGLIAALELLCPVGLRYHSLHDMLPSLPYHSLPQAHRILMRELPDNSPYRQTNSSGICATIMQLLRDGRRAIALKRGRS